MWWLCRGASLRRDIRGIIDIDIELQEVRTHQSAQHYWSANNERQARPTRSGVECIYWRTETWTVVVVVPIRFMFPIHIILCSMVDATLSKLAWQKEFPPLPCCPLSSPSPWSGGALYYDLPAGRSRCLNRFLYILALKSVIFGSTQL